VYAIPVRVTDSGSPALFADGTVSVTVLPNLDADGNGAAEAGDGQIILRYLAGAPDGQLLTGVTPGAGATRTTAAALRSYLDAGKTLLPRMLDADGNGQVTALTDGRLISRYLAGITTDALVGGSVLGAGATRTTAATIAAYLDGFRPAAPLAPQSAELLLANATMAAAPGDALDPPPQPALTPQSLESDLLAVRSGAPGDLLTVAPLRRSIADRLAGAGRLAERPGRDLLIDWSRAWSGQRHAHEPEKRGAWLKPFRLDFAEDDPNVGLEVAMSDQTLVR
jgi:hypothetical protein